MGNALQSTMAAVNAGFIGKNPLEGKLAAIDKGIKGVQDWKANIDKQRLELKQTTAKQIREAELKVYENMPSDETAQAKVLEGLAKYKDQMLINERLVRNGSVPPQENLIFFENGKQSFDIFAQNVSSYDQELELTKKRAQGYTDPETGEFVQPTSGELEAAMQKIQTAIGTLSGIDINFSEKGMGQIDFFQMEVDPKTHTYRPKVDENGNKIPIEGQSNMSVLALKHKANGRADRVNVSGLTETFTKKGLATEYDVMATEGIMVGNVITDLRNNPDRASILNNAVAADSSGVQQVASILSKDNGIPTEYVPFNEWDMLSDADKNETIEITVLDENMEEKSVNVKKYVRVAAANENNAIVPEMDEDQINAAQGYLRKSYADALQRKITKGTKRSEFDQSTPQKRGGSQSDIDKGTRTIAALNNLRGATTKQDMELAIQELQGISGLSYSDISETTKTVSVPDGKGGFTEEEVVTAVNLNLGGQIIPVEFGEVVQDEQGRDVFKQTSGEDFVKANYEYFNKGGVSADIGFDEFKRRGSNLFEDVSQPGKGTRTKTYKQTKNVTLAGEYNLGGSKTSLSTQLKNAFDKADEAAVEVAGVGANNDVNALASGIEAAIGSAYDASGLSVPQGFDVTASGGDVIISAIDSEGIKVTETLKDIDEAVSNAGPGLVDGAVQSFLNKMNQ